jgi:hypothetical protein
MGEFVVLMRDVEKSLGGDAANVETGASECSSFLDADSVHAQLRSLDGSDVA